MRKLNRQHTEDDDDDSDDSWDEMDSLSPNDMMKKETIEKHIK